ncbi:MAG TPA: M48 family metallopeptidase [Alphaproteobacteria bacterium]|nr:M48 family metallopeptidase [Alphaproteobacteria bacterium]
MNAFDETAANKFKSYLLMFCFSLVVIALGYVFGYIYGDGSPAIITTFMTIAFIISICMALYSYYNGDKAALSVSKAYLANRKDHAHYINSVEGLAIAAQIPTPKIYVLPDQSINAFATGRDPEHASIAMTEGALKKLNRVELEGVIAHEMGHIKNYDMRLMTITVVLVGLIALLSDFFFRSMLFGGGSDNDREINPVFLVLAIVLAILAPIIAQLIQLAISRKREYAADATGAILSRHPEGLANALKKIGKEHLESKTATKATAHLYFSNPLKGGFWNNMFSTHPPLAERIRRLEAM